MVQPNETIETFSKLEKNVSELLRVCRGTEIEVVHIRALYSEEINSKWMNEFRRLNPTKGNPEIDGTYEVEPFAKETDREMLFLKSCYDGFQETALHSFLQEKNIERVLCAGLITSACVQHTAHGAFSRGYRVDLIEDCCADPTWNTTALFFVWQLHVHSLNLRRSAKNLGKLTKNCMIAESSDIHRRYLVMILILHQLRN